MSVKFYVFPGNCQFVEEILWVVATPPPLLRGTRGHSKDIWVNWIGLGCVGLDCHRMTAIYSLLLFPLFKCQYPCERGILSTPLDQLQIIEECKTTNRVFPSLKANVGGLHHMPNAIWYGRVNMFSTSSFEPLFNSKYQMSSPPFIYVIHTWHVHR